MVYSAVRERDRSRPKRPEQAVGALVATRAVVSLDDRRYVLDGPRATIGRSKDGRVRARATPTSPAATPSCAAPSPATGRSSTSARPTGSRSTAAASPRPGSAPATR